MNIISWIISLLLLVSAGFATVGLIFNPKSEKFKIAWNIANIGFYIGIIGELLLSIKSKNTFIVIFCIAVLIVSAFCDISKTLNKSEDKINA